MGKRGKAMGLSQKMLVPGCFGRQEDGRSKGESNAKPWANPPRPLGCGRKAEALRAISLEPAFP